MQRKIDEIGRIVIPIELRRELDFTPGMLDFEVEMINNRKRLVLKRIEDKCKICGSENSIMTILGFKICKDCNEKLKSYYK